MGVCALTVAMAAGCATKGAELTADSPPEVKAAAVKERASARWAELIKGNRDAAYAYLSAGARQMMSLEQYNARVKTGEFRAVQIHKVDCEAEICTVKLQLTYDYRSTKGVGAAKGITTAVQETWVVEKGQAWFVMGP
jgi:hypothetical protein